MTAYDFTALMVQGQIDEAVGVGGKFCNLFQQIIRDDNALSLIKNGLDQHFCVDIKARCYGEHAWSSLNFGITVIIILQYYGQDFLGGSFVAEHQWGSLISGLTHWVTCIDRSPFRCVLRNGPAKEGLQHPKASTANIFPMTPYFLGPAFAYIGISTVVSRMALFSAT